jgi:hypothetical protein
MTVQEAYKCGFLLRCALEGLGPTEIEARITKSAQLKAADGLIPGLAALPGKLVGGVVQTGENVSDIFKNLWPYLQSGLFHSTISAPVLGGLATGYGLSRLGDASVSPEDAKQEELLAEYRRALGALNRKPV